MDVYNQEIGRRLFNVRKSCHLTQAEVAQKMGLSFQQIQKYERGMSQISLVRLHEMAAAFHMSDMKLYQYLMATEDPVADSLSTKIRKLSPYIQAILFNLIDALARDA